MDSNLSVLPKPSVDKTGWPWTTEVQPEAYKNFKNLPKISVVTPSYNQENFLEETIRSVLLQNYPNLELIIIDGGSTDGSLEIIKKYEPWIAHWVSEKDRGQSHAINKGFERATGDLIGWQNSDDIYLKDAFLNIASIYEKKPEYDVYFGNMVTIDQNSDVIHKHLYAPFSFNEIKYSGWNITNQSCFFSKNILNQVQVNENYRYAMDASLYYQIASKTNKFVHVKKQLGAFRIHEEAKSSNISISIGWKEWVQLRSDYGIKMKPDVPWEKQFKAWKIYFKLRKAFYYLPDLMLGRLSLRS